MLGLFGYLLYQLFHESIHHNYDRHLRFEAEQILPFIDTGGDSLTIDLTGYSRNEALSSGVEYGTYIRLYNRSDSLIYQSPNFTPVEEPLEARIPASLQEYSFSSQWQSLPARTLFYPLTGQENELQGWLEVTGFEWTLHEEVTRFRQSIIVFIVISVAFSILGGYLLSRGALSPVTSITDAAKSITTTDLDKRIPVNYQVRDELTDLAETFNMMLSRLQKGFEREKRFSSDAAHELMTPLSSLRSEAEIMLRKPRNREEYRSSIERMLSEIHRMSEMVHLLLQLSRVESAHPPDPDAIDISRLAEQVADKFRSLALEKNIELKIGIDPGLHIQAHTAYLEEVMHNLLENSLKYTPAGGTIQLKLQHSGRKVVLSLSDTGIGFDEEARKHLFERFYRVNHQKIQERPGSGLGLSLIRAIVELYDGKVQAYSEGIDQGSTFVVELPLADDNIS